MLANFEAALHAPGPAPELAGKLGLYGRFVGSWRMTATTWSDDGAAHQGRGEVHFGWVLQGRAVQDVWVLEGVFYGTTLRIYDPSLDAWHVIWSDPVRQYYARQVGRAEGPEIVQEGANAAGARLRWRFTEITERSFRWLGARSLDAGASWHTQADFRLTRVQGED
ncbi:MAG TPA: hypothetical protein VFA03_13885 [Acetobacteraceae bacterium]|nr:hypothetical protein [Acetobacteraceae bacterium]